MRPFVLATANAHKVEQMRVVLEPLGVELLGRPADVGEIDETENTLEGNALLKARAIGEATGLPAIADDTGLFVDALDGRPGVFSARYAGESASYEENVRRLLAELEGVKEPRRTARFRSVIAVRYPEGTSWTVEGVLEGVILESPVGFNGFGYDPVFAPVGHGGRSLAQMELQDKLALSHRGIALRAFAAQLAST